MTRQCDRITIIGSLIRLLWKPIGNLYYLDIILIRDVFLEV